MSLGTISLFGRAVLIRDWCEHCKCMSIVLDGYFQCCDEKAKAITITRIERQSDTCRGRISAELKRKILVAQKHRCHYCGLDLSRTWYYMDKYGDYREIKINFDHFIPASFACVETFENLYATCSICNRYKASKMFNSIEELRIYLKNRIIKAGVSKIYSANEIEDYESK